MSYFESLLRPPASPAARRTVAVPALETQAVEQVAAHPAEGDVADDRRMVRREGAPAPELPPVPEPPEGPTVSSHARLEPVGTRPQEGRLTAPEEAGATGEAGIERFEVSRFVVVEPMAAPSLPDEASDVSTDAARRPDVGPPRTRARGPSDGGATASPLAAQRDVDAPASIAAKALADLRDELAPERRAPVDLEFGERHREALARPSASPDAETAHIPSKERGSQPVQVRIGTIALTVKAAPAASPPAAPVPARPAPAERLSPPARTPSEGFAFSARRHYLRWS
jgi:hypothetical protein